MIEDLEQLVAFQSVTADQHAVLQLLTYVARNLEACGFAVTIITHNNIHSLYAAPTVSKHSKILLQGHIDIVPGDQPFRREQDACFGRGTFDMLFATAAYLRLARELGSKSHDIAFMLTGDEEIGGFNGTKHLLDMGYTADICVLPDAGEGWGTMNVAAKGVYHPTIRINGRAHHGSRPWEGDGAISKTAHFLTSIETIFDTTDRHSSTFSATKIQGGHAHNQAPATAEVSLDIRYKDASDLTRIKRELRRLVKAHDGEFISETEASDYQLDQSLPLVKQFIELYEHKVGRPIGFTKAHGSSDARFFSERGIPVIMARPDGGGAHGDNEWISLAMMEKFYDLLKDYVTTVATRV